MPQIYFFYERQPSHRLIVWRYWLVPHNQTMGRRDETVLIHTDCVPYSASRALEHAQAWALANRGPDAYVQVESERRPQCATDIVYADEANHPDAWQWREAEAQDRRILPVWAGERWYREAIYPTSDHPAKLHYLHVSANDRALLAYTTDAAKGRRNIQTPIKPGRYLTRYFGNVLTAKQIASYAAWQSTGNKVSEYTNERDYPLAFAHSSDEIVDVYARGPQSCMSGDADNWSYGHPAQVYGAGDLAVAYMRRDSDGKIVARALVWPAKKLMGRVYPSNHCWNDDGFASQGDSEDCNEALATRLQAQGYRTGHASGTTFDGAKLLKILSHGRLVMPYLDHGYKINVMDDYCEMHSRGATAADYTSGWIDYDGPDDDAEPEYEYTCDNCDEGVDDVSTVLTGVHVYRGEVDWRSQCWCETCRDNDAFYCEGLREDVSKDVESADVGAERYSIPWLELHGFRSEYSGAWCLNDDRVVVDGEAWSQDEADAYAVPDPETGELTRARHDTTRAPIEDARQAELIAGD